ncbi:MAG: hypothetical protein NXH89_10760 [Cyclobacteriaceae bacterium]|nr:hypothetical protein [Cyclobacteriaceae bacterium]
MKKRFAILLFAGISLVSYTNLSAECATGGKGAKSCTFRSQVSILGLKLWSVKGSSVSCGKGYYECCNATEATCVKTATLAN